MDTLFFAGCSAATTFVVVVAALAIRLRRERAKGDLLQREADNLRELARLWANRVATLSHEVRTPLALIQGAGELLADASAGPLTADQQKFTRTILDNCSHVISLSEDLLSQARLEAKIFDLRMQDVELRRLVRTTVRDLRQIHSTIIQSDNHGRPIYVQADPRLLREVLWNLGNNAVRHAGKGATVTFRLTRGDGQAVIAVEDNGPGIDREIRSRMFDQYETTASDGTGLGLSITRTIIELHGGKVLVDSTRRGTVMYCTIPTGGDDEIS